MSNAVIIVAGGKGSRAGTEKPKQFVELAGAPMIFHTLRAFQDYDPKIEIVVVMNPDYIPFYLDMLNSLGCPIAHRIAPGGKTRVESVMAGLVILQRQSASDLSQLKVAIHDAARPLITREVIARGMECVKKGVGAVPVIPAVNSLREFIPPMEKSLALQASRSVRRSDFVEVQTPQIFYFPDIQSAYKKIKNPENFTDDASVAESAGMDITLYEGDPINLKVTNPMDFAIAETLLAQKV